MRADAAGVAGADEFVNRLARGTVTVPFRAFEPFGMHRQNRDAGFLRHALANGSHIVANQSDDAGGIHERRLRLVMRDKFEQRGFEFFFASENHIQFLEVGGKTVAMELGAGR